MSWERTGISFKGCTRAQALQRMEVFLDEREEEMVRSFASRLMLDELLTDEEFISQVFQLRMSLADSHDACLARCAQVFDEALALSGSDATAQ